ncbi:helix-turn-helix transcriptional regulator [Halomonas maura]|uniref:helix-turn-helix transcriptional regulator n=1 Tax=Halomonas maura TaxID=117606 RepID=UPI0025B56585|nr:AlpA family phage regulatory protein [Halomonas maura]MDN3554701.1 AlpA family phage regulatory protein [Halomonas maura]
MTKLIRKNEVLARCAISKSTLHRLIQNGGFPRPVKISDRCVAWVEHEVDEWMANRERSC